MTKETLLLGALALTLVPVLYSYLIYPLGVAGLARLWGREPSPYPDRGSSDTRAGLPFVTILVAAHNEQSVIGERIENALTSDYPEDRLEILIASDGSTDDTDAIVAGYRDPRVRLLSHQPNRGKSFALNRAVPVAAGEIIVMSDANTQFQPDAVLNLVTSLTGPGQPVAVCGKLILVDPQSGGNVDGLYWRYESWQKQNEGRLAATLGANGGIYAFRREQYVPIPDNTILDDMSIPLLMKQRHGGNIVFEPRAIAIEEAAPSMADEFGRRVRIGTGAYQSIALLYPLLHPRHGFTAIAFLSHKLLRWFTPHLLLAAALITVFGLQYPSLRFAALGWLAAAAASLAGRLIGGSSLPARALRLATMFTSMNTALMLGFVRWLRESQTGTWKRTARES